MKEIKILLLYPPEQSWPKTMVKPNGSLAYPYLAGALRDINVESYIYEQKHHFQGGISSEFHNSIIFSIGPPNFIALRSLVLVYQNDRHFTLYNSQFFQNI